MPRLCHYWRIIPQHGWGRIVQHVGGNQWLLQQPHQAHHCQSDEFEFIARIQLSSAHVEKRRMTFKQLLNQNLTRHKDVVVEAVIASLMINFLALASSLFSTCRCMTASFLPTVSTR